jgi:hypothetical protein
MKLLIKTVAGDSHAAAAAAVLRELDVELLFSVGTDVPSRQCVSLYIDQGRLDTLLRRHGEFVGLDRSLDLVWSRRARLFELPDIHPDDVDQAEREFRLFLTGFWEISAPRAIHVNPERSRQLANTKLVQLVAAKKCGFAISPTLASHDPDAIKRFVEQHGPNNVIFKTFSPASWGDREGRHYATPATLLDREILDEPESLRICPGIYQRFIAKAKELRVTVMGERVRCVEVIAPAGAAVDWRVNQHHLRVEPCSLPPAVEQACRKVLSELGLLFGCIDLILGRDGNWYFLEVNEMGQFLWIESLCPDERYLEAFVQFLFRLCDALPIPSGIVLSEVLGSPEYGEIMDNILASDDRDADCPGERAMLRNGASLDIGQGVGRRA